MIPEPPLATLASLEFSPSPLYSLASFVRNLFPDEVASAQRLPVTAA